MQRLLANVALLCLLAAAAPALAHSLGMSLLRLTETGPGHYSVAWQPSEALTRRVGETAPVFPEGCDYQPPRLHCPEGLQGEIRFPGLPAHAGLVLQQTDDQGHARYRVVSDGRIEVAVGPPPGAGRVAADYFGIGIEHIALGIDHLLFVAGLALLVGFNRKLVWTVTAFTLSHSLTLALSALELVSVSIAAVETVIALSIVLVIREAMTERRTLARRWPWLVAFGFGLIHGLGFASALQEIGLPGDQELLALLTFNLGVEAGQLVAVAVFFVLVRVLTSVPALPPRLARQVACYAMGTIASFWTLERALYLAG